MSDLSGGDAAGMDEGAEGRIKVLLIDDDEDEGDLLAFFLRRRFGDGFELRHERDFDGAMDALRSATFSVVFLDHRLPPYTGIDQTVPLIRSVAPDMRIIAISSALHDDLLDTARTLDGVDVIDKLELNDRIAGGLIG